jgi:hypothetical protein
LRHATKPGFSGLDGNSVDNPRVSFHCCSSTLIGDTDRAISLYHQNRDGRRQATAGEAVDTPGLAAIPGRLPRMNPA